MVRAPRRLRLACAYRWRADRCRVWLWLPGMCSTDAVVAVVVRASCQLLAAEGWDRSCSRMHGGIWLLK